MTALSLLLATIATLSPHPILTPAVEAFATGTVPPAAWQAGQSELPGEKPEPKPEQEEEAKEEAWPRTVRGRIVLDPDAAKDVFVKDVHVVTLTGSYMPQPGGFPPFVTVNMTALEIEPVAVAADGTFSFEAPGELTSLTATVQGKFTRGSVSLDWPAVSDEPVVRDNIEIPASIGCSVRFIFEPSKDTAYDPSVLIGRQIPVPYFQSPSSWKVFPDERHVTVQEDLSVEVDGLRTSFDQEHNAWPGFRMLQPYQIDPDWKPEFVPGTRQEIRVPLLDTTTLRWNVVGPDGEAVENARATTTWTRRVIGQLARTQGRIGEDGLLRLGSPQLGQMRVEVRADGYQSSAVDILALEVNSPEVRTVALERSFELNALLIAHDGLPVTNVAVEVLSKGVGGSKYRSRADDEGRVKVLLPSVGLYAVHVIDGFELDGEQERYRGSGGHLRWPASGPSLVIVEPGAEELIITVPVPSSATIELEGAAESGSRVVSLRWAPLDPDDLRPLSATASYHHKFEWRDGQQILWSSGVWTVDRGKAAWDAHEPHASIDVEEDPRNRPPLWMIPPMGDGFISGRTQGAENLREAGPGPARQRSVVTLRSLESGWIHHNTIEEAGDFGPLRVKAGTYCAIATMNGVVGSSAAFEVGPGEQVQVPPMRWGHGGSVSGRFPNHSTANRSLELAFRTEAGGFPLDTRPRLTEDGSFNFGDLPPGRMRLSAHWTNAETGRLEVVPCDFEIVDEEHQEISFGAWLEPTTIRGVVRTGEDRLVPYAIVEASEPGGRIWSTLAAEDGSFSLAVGAGEIDDTVLRVLPPLVPSSRPPEDVTAAVQIRLGDPSIDPAQPLNIRLPTGRVDGFVLATKQGPRTGRLGPREESWVLLLPRGRELRHGEELTSAGVRIDGTFSARYVADGEYVAVLLDRSSHGQRGTTGRVLRLLATSQAFRVAEGAILEGVRLDFGFGVAIDVDWMRSL